MKLEILQLPYAEILPPEGKIMTPDLQLKLQALQNQIMFLNTQVQTKDATISSLLATTKSQENTINQQSEKLLLIESLKEPKDLEFGDGAVKLGEQTFFGITLNPKKAVDFLKGKKKTDD